MLKDVRGRRLARRSQRLATLDIGRGCRGHLPLLTTGAENLAVWGTTEVLRKLLGENQMVANRGIEADRARLAYRGHL